jgi:putative ATP-binding cassette transporter
MTLAPPLLPEARPPRRRILQDFGRFAGGWWRGPTAPKAWTLTAALGGVLVLNIAPTSRSTAGTACSSMPSSSATARTLVLAVFVFLGPRGVRGGIGVVIVVARETLQVRWREWLVGRLIDTWTAQKRFYRWASPARSPRTRNTASPTTAAWPRSRWWISPSGSFTRS